MRNATLVTFSLTIAGALLTIARADQPAPDVREDADSGHAPVSLARTDHGCVKPDAESAAGAQDAARPADVGKRIVFGP